MSANYKFDNNSHLVSESDFYYYKTMNNNVGGGGGTNIPMQTVSIPAKEIKTRNSSEQKSAKCVQCILPLLCILQIINVVTVSFCFYQYGTLERDLREEYKTLIEQNIRTLRQENENQTEQILRTLRQEYRGILGQNVSDKVIQVERLKNDLDKDIKNFREEMTVNMNRQEEMIKETKDIAANLTIAKKTMYDYEPPSYDDDNYDDEGGDNEASPPQSPPPIVPESDEEQDNERPISFPPGKISLPRDSIHLSRKPSYEVEKFDDSSNESDTENATYTPETSIGNNENEDVSDVISSSTVNPVNPITVNPVNLTEDFTINPDDSTEDFKINPDDLDLTKDGINRWAENAKLDDNLIEMTTKPENPSEKVRRQTRNIYKYQKEVNPFQKEKDSYRKDKGLYEGVDIEKNETEEEELRNTDNLNRQRKVSKVEIEEKVKMEKASDRLHSVPKQNSFISDVYNSVEPNNQTRTIIPRTEDSLIHRKETVLAMNQMVLPLDTELISTPDQMDRSTPETIAVHLVGDTSKPRLSKEKHYDANHRMYHPKGHIKDWNVDSRTIMDNNYNHDQYFKLENGHLKVKQGGLYFVYAQIFYSTKEDTSGFNVHVNDNIVMRCITTGVSTEQMGGVHSTAPNSCYTAGLVRIQPDDNLSIKEMQGERYTVFEPTRSFFGLFKLG